MRQVIHGALAGAREIAVGLARDVRREMSKRTDDEWLHAYVKVFRGNPVALSQWIAQQQRSGKMPAGNPLTLMRKIESRSEQMLAERGMDDAVPVSDEKKV